MSYDMRYPWDDPRHLPTRRQRIKKIIGDILLLLIVIVGAIFMAAVIIATVIDA